MSDAALEAENAMLRERLAKLEAARPADMEGFRQLNDAIVENRLGAFVREKGQPRWMRIAIPILVCAPLVYFAVGIIGALLSRL